MELDSFLISSSDRTGEESLLLGSRWDLCLYVHVDHHATKRKAAAGLYVRCFEGLIFRAGSREIPVLGTLGPNNGIMSLKTNDAKSLEARSGRPE